MTSARPARTSITDPLRIDEVSIPGYEGVIGLTLCPGKEDPWSSTGPWKRDLGLDLAAIRDWGAAMLLSLIEPDEYDRVKVADMGRRIPEGMEQLRLPIKDVSVPDKSWEEAWVREGRGCGSFCARAAGSAFTAWEDWAGQASSRRGSSWSLGFLRKKRWPESGPRGREP